MCVLTDWLTCVGGGENALDELRPSTAPDFRDTYVLGGDLPVPPSTVLLAADARSTANQRLVSNSSGGSSSSPSVFGRKLFPHRSTSSMTGGNGDGNSSSPPQLDRKLSRQMSTSSMNSGSMRLKQPTQPHELDEEQYKKITFMRNTERGMHAHCTIIILFHSSDCFHYCVLTTVVSSTEDGRARSNSALNARYVASTARVKVRLSPSCILLYVFLLLCSISICSEFGRNPARGPAAAHPAARDGRPGSGCCCRHGRSCCLATLHCVAM